MSGSLTIVGTGYRLAGQATAESVAAMRRADKLFFVVSDSLTAHWLGTLNENSESLADSYAVGKKRGDTYQEMVSRMLAPVREGLSVCGAFYGHPGVFATPPHVSIRQARAEGFEARMLPGISSVDCLLADLAVDPSATGCQTLEASYFLVRPRDIDPRCALILLQIGGVGIDTYETARLWSRRGLQYLVKELIKIYPADHEVVVYEASPYPVCEPTMLHLPLASVPDADVNVCSTLYVPPAEKSFPDPEMLARLGLAGDA